MNKYIKCVFLKPLCVSIFLFFVLTVTVFAYEKTDTINNHISIGGSYDYPPYSYIDKNGYPAGFSVDISRAIGDVLNREIVFNLEPWNEVLQSLQANKTNLIHDIIYSDERTQLYTFSAPYYISPYAIFSKKGAPKLASFSDLAGKKIVVIEGDIGQDYIEEQNLNAIILAVDNYSDAILLLEKGEVQYTLIDQLVGLYWQKTLGTKNIELTKIIPFQTKYCYAKTIGESELVLEINGALSILKQNGKYQEIYSTWMSKIDPRSISITDVIRKYLYILIFVLLFVIVLFLWNITLRMKVAQRTKSLETTNKFLQERENRIRSISNNIPSGMIYQVLIAKDGSRTFTYLSDSVESLYGIKPNQGIADSNLIYNKIYPEDFSRLKQEEKNAIESGTSLKIELRINEGTESHRWSLIVAKPRVYDDGIICLDGIEFIITDQKIAESKINALLAEKELLLKEVHQRIKNNMNTIKSLISLQISAEKNILTAATLKDTERRVQSIMMLYDRLYLSENYRELSARDYIQPLAEEIICSFPNSKSVKVYINIDDFILNAQRLTPLGIITNELLTNIMKYAFTGRESGSIHISSSLKDTHVLFVIQDDGIGIPESINFKNSTGFGMQLVWMLTEQIKGSIEIVRGEGTTFIVRFES